MRHEKCDENRAGNALIRRHDLHSAFRFARSAAVEDLTALAVCIIPQPGGTVESV